MSPVRSLAVTALLCALVRGQAFTDVATAAGFPSANDQTRGMGWADFDGDGDFDVYVQNNGGTSRLFRNDGGVFVDVTAAMGTSHASSGWSCAWADYDGDGKPDLYLGNFAGNNLFRNQYPGPFVDVSAAIGAANSEFAQSVTWVDHDNDGDLDLFVAKELTPFTFFENHGGVFADVSQSTGLADPQAHAYGVAWCDFDSDGDVDCFLSTCSGATVNRLFRNNRIGTGQPNYTEIAAAAGVDYSPNTYGTEWADFDGDGDYDLFVAGAAGEPNHLYRNDGVLPMLDVAQAAGLFGPPSYGRGCDIGDYDNDGLVDIYLSMPAGPNLLYRNLGNLTFQVVPNAAGANASNTNGYDCAFVDYDNDGDLDIHVGALNRDKLYRNSGSANHWLQVTPRGTRDNRSAIGATVEVVIGATHQYRLMNSASGAFSQNLLPAHFGCGAAATVDQVIVHWMDGTTDVLLGVTTNQRITIQQSSALAQKSVVGQGCPGFFNLIPQLGGAGLPTLGNPTFAATLATGAPLSAATLFASTSVGPALDVGNGCILRLDLAGFAALTQAGLNPLGTATTSGLGACQFPLPVPAVPPLAGMSFAVQAIILDAAGPPVVGNPSLRFTLSNALSLQFGY